MHICICVYLSCISLMCAGGSSVRDPHTSAMSSVVSFHLITPVVNYAAADVDDVTATHTRTHIHVHRQRDRETQSERDGQGA